MILPSFHRIRSTSLKWKVLIPFLFFAFAGTTILSYIGLTSQQRLITEEEKKKMVHYHRLFMEEINHKRTKALTLATLIAEIPEVQRLLAERNRRALNDLLVQTYVQMKVDFDIEQFHFHVPPGVSFLRLHYPERFGQDLTHYRKTITEAMGRYTGVSGLEKGEGGFGIRGVAPVFYGREMVGTVEIGHSFGDAFLIDFHQRWGTDLALYEVKDKNSYKSLAKAAKIPGGLLSGRELATVSTEKPTILIAPKNHPDRSILLGPVEDYSGNVVALVEMNFDRAERQRGCLRREL